MNINTNNRRLCNFQAINFFTLVSQTELISAERANLLFIWSKFI